MVLFTLQGGNPPGSPIHMEGTWQLRNPAGSGHDSLALHPTIPFVIQSTGGVPNFPVSFVPHPGDLIMVLAELWLLITSGRGLADP